LKKSLEDCLEVLGNRKAAIARELTKMHEEILRGDFQELIEKFADTEPRGEIVLVIDREETQNLKSQVQSQKTITERVSELEDEGLDNRAALKQAAREFGLSRSEAYRRLIGEKKTE
jgi:16S rRNA (cytidine1402-2'-O)-methyltransferase